MIVNQIEQGWETIYQPAHALVSGQLAARWAWAEAEPPRWWETVIAVSQHDNGWREWEVAPCINDDGMPRNFADGTLPDAIAQWTRGVARAQHQSRWVGLLVSRHATTLFEARQGETEALDAFLVEQKTQQEAWRTALGVNEELVAQAYRMLRWGDWMSLVLCWRRLPEDGQTIALGVGPDNVQYEARRRANETVAVSPWPFNEERFTVSVETRVLGQLTFESDAALLDALQRATVQTRTWELAQ